MIDIRYFILLFAWVLLLIGIWFKNYTITTIAGMFLMVMGIYIVWYDGLPNANNILKYAVGWTSTGIGGYIFVRCSLEEIVKYF